MKFENFKKKVADLIIQAHPGEDLDIRNGSTLFQVLQSDLNARHDMAEELSTALNEIESLKDV